MKLLDHLEKYTAEELLYKGELIGLSIAGDHKVQITELKLCTRTMIGYSIELSNSRNYVAGIRVFIDPVTQFGREVYKIKLSTPSHVNDWVVTVNNKTVSGTETKTISGFNGPISIVELISNLVQTTKRLNDWKKGRVG